MMQKSKIEQMAILLREKLEQNEGKLPELDGIAWHAYLHEGVIDHVDYIEWFRNFFPTLDDDPEANDPVLAIAIGKFNVEDPSISEGDCVFQTTFEGLSLDIRDVAANFGGMLPPPFSVAYEAKLLALYHSHEITDSEYEQLLAMIPIVENSPVAEIKSIMQKFQNSKNPIS